ncbi:hypothetical protein F5Y15DRAFT_415290 [Xylariaceae sp. FL0016]|nr:hypothetical protein F5Y15DRAFT_415290 [Xylariaceae sp. FL0016]
MDAASFYATSVYSQVSDTPLISGAPYTEKSDSETTSHQQQHLLSLPSRHCGPIMSRDSASEANLEEKVATGGIGNLTLRTVDSHDIYTCRRRGRAINQQASNHTDTRPNDEENLDIDDMIAAGEISSLSLRMVDSRDVSRCRRVPSPHNRSVRANIKNKITQIRQRVQTTASEAYRKLGEWRRSLPDDSFASERFARQSRSHNQYIRVTAINMHRGGLLNDW